MDSKNSLIIYIGRGLLLVVYAIFMVGVKKDYTNIGAMLIVASAGLIMLLVTTLWKSRRLKADAKFGAPTA